MTAEELFSSAALLDEAASPFGTEGTHLVVVSGGNDE